MRDRAWIQPLCFYRPLAGSGKSLHERVGKLCRLLVSHNSVAELRLFNITPQPRAQT